MDGNKKIVAIIPARGGSKSIPRKNLIKIGGKPLIAYTVEAALGVKSIDRVIVSSDDEEILSVAKSYGAQVMQRPKQFATDSANSESVVSHTLDYLRKSGEVFETVVFLQPTSPLRDKDDIKGALKQYFGQKATALISVCKPDHTPFKAFKVNRKGFLEGLLDNKTPFLPRQDLPQAYLPNGAIYIVDSKEFLKNQSFFTSKTVFFQMTAEKSIDLDSREDIKLLEQKLGGTALPMEIINQTVNSPKVLAVIPARGGSKRLPGKNIKPLVGKPLIAYAIKAALGANLVDEVIVSTDDERIAEVAKRHGAEVPFLRPAELASDTALTMDVVDHAVSFLEREGDRHYQIVVLVQTTSPLIWPLDIDRAIAQLILSGTRSCVSMCEVTDRPDWIYTQDESGKVFPYAFGCDEKTRSQDPRKFFRLNGAVYAMRRDVVKKGGIIIKNDDLSSIVMERERSIDIDEQIDLEIAEAIIKKNKRND